MMTREREVRVLEVLRNRSYTTLILYTMFHFEVFPKLQEEDSPKKEKEDTTMNEHNYSSKETSNQRHFNKSEGLEEYEW
jgi:hypothetical protein